MLLVKRRGVRVATIVVHLALVVARSLALQGHITKFLTYRANGRTYAFCRKQRSTCSHYSCTFRL